jgi:hypothetical protein
MKTLVKLLAGFGKQLSRLEESKKCQFAGKTSQGFAGENHPPLR